MKNVGNEWQQSAEQLLQAQMQAGQSAFEALNEHDKLINMIQTLAAEVEGLFSCMDMVNMEIAEALGKTSEDDRQKEEQERLLVLNEQSAAAAERFAQALQDIMRQAEIGSEKIHKMEEDIAAEQEAFFELRAAVE